MNTFLVTTGAIGVCLTVYWFFKETIEHGNMVGKTTGSLKRIEEEMREVMSSMAKMESTINGRIISIENKHENSMELINDRLTEIEGGDSGFTDVDPRVTSKNGVSFVEKGFRSEFEY